MEKIPNEILELIASNLNAQDLGEFRLVSRRWAGAGGPLIASNGISVLNTFDCIQELKHFLRLNLVSTTKRLTVYHGEWQVCNRREWEIHPLLRGGNDRSSLAYVQDRYAIKADAAFKSYSDFIHKEENRCYEVDVESISQALFGLKNLTTIKISQMQTWHPSTNIKYRKLQKEIWMSPNRQDNISRLVEAFLLGLGRGFLNIKTLEINGCFNAADVRITQTTTFSGIQTLEVRSFQLLNSQEATRSFLLASPNLLYLSIGFQGWGPSIPDIIGELKWRKLRTLCLHDIWASEQDILGILEHHMSTLKEFSLHHAALTQGS